MVTQASKSVYGEEARDGYVKATLLSRRIMPALNSKQDHNINVQSTRQLAGVISQYKMGSKLKNNLRTLLFC